MMLLMVLFVDGFGDGWCWLWCCWWWQWWSCCWWWWVVMVLAMVVMVFVMGVEGVGDGASFWVCIWNGLGKPNNLMGLFRNCLWKEREGLGGVVFSGTWCMQVCNHQPALVWRQKILCWIMKFVGAVTYSEWVRNPASEPSNSSLSRYCNYMHG